MKLSDCNVLVTGAAGFIGSHLVEALVERGARVRAMTHYRSDPTLHNLEFVPREVRDQIEIVRGSIDDEAFVRRAVAGCDVVFHLAALIGIPYSYVAPVSYLNVNLKGTLNILEACRDADTHRLVHTSTSECYGTARYTPIDEAHPLQGQSPYSASKIGADKLVESYSRSFALPVVTVRPFNTFGPRQSTRAITSTIAVQLLSGADRLRLGSLDPVRDLTYVTDTVGGFMQAAEADGVMGEEINLGSGKGVTIRELANRLMTITGRQVPIESDPKRIRPPESEVWELICDNSKARNLLGWQPSISLDEGLGHVVEFLRDNIDMSNSCEYGV